jgi:hypothetical protein
MGFVTLGTGCDACGRKTGSDGPLGSSVTTYSILAAQSPACLSWELADAGGANGSPTPLRALAGCAVRNGCLDPIQQGGTCELTDGLVPSALPNQPGSRPEDPPPPNEGYTANCLQTLHDIFATHCADSLALTPCLCGKDPFAVEPCLEGQAPPAGPLLSDYARSFGSKNAKKINEKFTMQTFGAGRANSIVQCLASFNCLCCFGQDGGC